jgi:hypothetical protein
VGDWSFPFIDFVTDVSVNFVSFIALFAVAWQHALYSAFIWLLEHGRDELVSEKGKVFFIPVFEGW